jgi:uncharacterized protein DUF5996
MGDDWPTFAREGGWPATHDYLHLIVQMLGKLRLALAPTLPEWGQVPLLLHPRGLTTGALATGAGPLAVTLEVAAGRIRIATSGQDDSWVQISPARSIAEVWTAYLAALAAAGVTVALWDKPQERDDATPFGADDRARSYDAPLAAAWWRVVADAHGWFDEWRSRFFGRSAVNFWWGGFDCTVDLFNGRHATPPAGADYLRRYEQDAEHLTVGFWPGDADELPRFFGYIVPAPAKSADYALGAPLASWSEALGEWVLPYESVRQTDRRAAVVRSFMDSIYRAAGDLAGWDLAAFTYTAPARARLSR